MFKKYLKDLSHPESYVSITLGFLVVIVAGLLLYNYMTKSGKSQKSEETKTAETKMEETSVLPATYNVAKGDTLWSIADKYYHSGYNWVTLAQENNLFNPDDIEIGQALKIPQAETIRPVAENISAASTQIERSYTVVRGDNLWAIAVKEYGDGYAWTRIAKANNLVNPRVIHRGNVLLIP